MAILVLENHPSQMALAGPLLVDSIGIPRYCATIWSDVILVGLASNTRIRHLYAVDRFYRAVKSNIDGDLDHMLMTADFEAIESALLSFHTALRNEAKIKKTSSDAAWKSCYRFIIDMLSYLGVRTEIRARELDTRLRRIRRLYGQLSPSPTKPPLPIRALPSQVVKELCEIFDPTHHRNPFRSKRERWRNYLVFSLLLHTGLRRSELAMLPSDAVSSSYDTKAGKDRHWINVGRHPYLDKDPRRDKPSLKTRYSSRQLPISEDLVTIVDIVRAYKKKGSLHPFIFGSQKGEATPSSILSTHPGSRNRLLVGGRQKSTWRPRDKCSDCA